MRPIGVPQVRAGRILSARWLNQVAAAMQYLQPNERQNAQPLDTPHEGVVVIPVKNATGYRQAPYSILGLDDEALLQIGPAAAYVGVAPVVGTHDRKFCVLLDAAEDGDVVDAAILGTVPVQVYIEDDDHDFAVLSDAETGYLTSAPSGPVAIIRTDIETSGSGSGSSEAEVVWCRCMIGPPADTIRPLYKATADETTGSGDVRTVDAKRVGADGTVDELADAVELTIQDDVSQVWEDDLLITQQDRHGATVAVLTDKYPVFGYATSDPSGGTLTIKRATSDGTLVGSDITVYDGGIT